MRIVIYGATGMVGQAALKAALAADDVTEVLAVGRTPLAAQHPKLKQLTLPDLLDYSKAPPLEGYDACFFALGVTSAGTDEATYTRITHDYALAAANALVQRNPGMTFIFVSGMGTDPDSKTMWARVKGRTEQDLMKLPFKAVYAFRPGFIYAMDGITSRTRLYRILYRFIAPFYPLLRSSNSVITTRQVGAAVLHVARQGAPKRILESADLKALAS